MNAKQLFDALKAATTIASVEVAMRAFETANRSLINWVPVGRRSNNMGTIAAAADSGRSLVERLTNAIDAVLEDEHRQHNGRPDCRTPKEAATAWLNVPERGLSEMTPAQRRNLAQKTTIRIQAGEGKDLRVVEIRDIGVGVSPEEMPGTILSLNESNKINKHYLAGAYGQGGSSTFASCRYTLVTSRAQNSERVGFTIVRYEDLPAEEFKLGRYVYLVVNETVLTFESPLAEFPTGTLIRHFGYDLSNYSSPLGPASVYGLLNQVLFDPVLPVWLDNSDVHNYRRVIKGSRNALNGAVDDGDDDRRGPRLSHSLRLFYVSLGEFGRVGLEYWALEPPTSENKKPIAAFVNPAKPIILTANGQNHGELSQSLIRKQAELPLLTQRLIVHVDCNHLTAAAKRSLFVSNREDARRGVVLDLIQREVINALKSDDDLTRLNAEARERGLHVEDEAAVQQMRQEVARLLRFHGMDFGLGIGAGIAGDDTTTDRPTRPRPPRPPPQPLELHEPPSYIRLVWKEGEAITFYPGQRRYLRIETDAHSHYHNPNDPARSRINLVVSIADVGLKGTTPLEGGRMRAIFESATSANIGRTGTLRVELMCAGQSLLADERQFRIVEPPPAQPMPRRLPMPDFRPQPVNGPEDSLWNELGWPDNERIVASSAEMSNGVLIIYYSTVFPKFVEQRRWFEHRDVALAESFQKRYVVWLAAHSLLLYQAQQDALANQTTSSPESDAADDDREREERCRIATMAGLFAAREIQLPPSTSEEE